jgi:hypothetical protein
MRKCLMRHKKLLKKITNTVRNSHVIKLAADNYTRYKNTLGSGNLPGRRRILVSLLIRLEFNMLRENGKVPEHYIF